MNVEMNFAKIAELWRALPRDSAGRGPINSNELESFFTMLTDSEIRGWFKACHRWIKGGPSPDDYPEIEQILNYSFDHERNAAEAHVECARLIRVYPQTPSEDVLIERLTVDLISMAGQRCIPLVLLQQISRELCLGNSGVKEGEDLKVIFPLSRDGKDSKKKEGELLSFNLERLPGGRGEIFLAPDQAFISLDCDFKKIFTDAPKAARALLDGAATDGFDIRVRIAPLDNEALPKIPALEGPSAGAALALGLAKNLCASGTIKEVDLRGVVITATVDEEGNLKPIGDIVPKLEAIRRYRERNGIYLIVLAQGQHTPDEMIPSLSESLCLIYESNLSEVVEALRELQSRVVMSVLRRRLVVGAYLLGSIWFWLGFVVVLLGCWYLLSGTLFVGAGLIWCLISFFAFLLIPTVQKAGSACPALSPSFGMSYPPKVWADKFATLGEKLPSRILRRICNWVEAQLRSTPAEDKLILSNIPAAWYVRRSYWARVVAGMIVLVLLLVLLLTPLQYSLGEMILPESSDFLGGMIRIDGRMNGRDDYKSLKAKRLSHLIYIMDADVGASGFVRIYVPDKPRTRRYLRITSDGQFYLRATGDGERQKTIEVAITDGKATFHYGVDESNPWEMRLIVELLTHKGERLKAAWLIGWRVPAASPRLKSSDERLRNNSRR